MARNLINKDLLRSDTATRKEIAEQFTPPQEVLDNLQTLCDNVLNPLQVMINETVIITSGYRCARLNKAIRGAKNSQHVLGQAADIYADGVGVDDLFQFIQNSKLDIDQLIQEFDTWVHVSYKSTGNRNQHLRAVKENGKTIYKPA